MNKKTITALSLVLGAALTASAAFADAIAGNGYYTIKDSLKRTTAVVASGEMDNFTICASLTLSADGSELYKTEGIKKFDGEASESHSLEIDTFNNVVDYESINYENREKNVIIYTDENGTRAVVYDLSDRDNEAKLLGYDPFQEEEVKDFETVIDAGVGNLKDALFVEENAEGKMYYGSIDNAQIPVFINALSSFMMKYSLFDEHNVKEIGLPEIRENISITNASGKAFENNDGILTEGIGSLTVAGNDKHGNPHEVILSIAISITDIGTTETQEPDLTGIETDYVDTEKTHANQNAIDEKYVGTYRADIVEVVDNQFVKIGEKRLVITEADGKNLAGTFEKTYTVADKENMYFEFTSFDPYENVDENAPKMHYYQGVPIKYTNSAGEEEHGILTNNYYGNDDEAAMIMLTLDLEFLEGGGWKYHGSSSFSLTRVME